MNKKSGWRTPTDFPGQWRIWVLTILMCCLPAVTEAQQAGGDTSSEPEAVRERPQAIQDFETPAARHVLSKSGMAPLYHAALLPFLERRTGYGAITFKSSSDESDPVVGDYNHEKLGARAGMVSPLGARLGIGFDAILDIRAHNIAEDAGGGGIVDLFDGLISGSIGAHLFRGWAVGASLGAFFNTVEQDIGGPGLETSEEFFDYMAIGVYWSAGFGWSSAERNVSFGWRIVNPRYHDGNLGSTPRNFIFYRDGEGDEGNVLQEEIPAPWATEGYFRVAFMENRLSFVLVSRREYHLGPDFGRARDFSHIQRDIIAEYAFNNRVAARLGYNRRDENYKEEFSTSGQGFLAGASFLAFNTIWDINLSYRQALRTMAPWSGETIPEFGVGLSLVRNW